MDYETKYIRLEAGTMAYLDHGEGDPVVLLHGLPTSKELFLPLLTHLSPGYRYIIPDLIQYGQSDQPDRHFTHKQRAKQLITFLDLLEIPSIVLIAHDLGASIALDFIGAYGDRVEKLVLMSPPVYPDFKIPIIVKIPRTPFIGPFTIWLMRGLLFRIGIKRGLVNKENYNTTVHNSFTSPFQSPHGRRILYRILNWGSPEIEFMDYPKIMKSIRVKTMVIHGKKDPYIPLSHSERLVVDIENADIEVIEQGSHFLPLDTPNQLVAILNNFLQEASSVSRSLE